MPSGRSDAYSIVATPDHAGLDRVHVTLDRLRNDHPELDSADRLSFRTAIAEIIANVIDHGDVPPGRLIELVAAVDETGLEGWIAVGGAAVPERELTPVPIDAERGRGLLLATSLCEVTYGHDRGVNVWHVRRRATIGASAVPPQGRDVDGLTSLVPSARNRAPSASAGSARPK